MTQPVNDDKYARSIRVTGSVDAGYRVFTDYPEAQKIEEGYPSYDMKPHLLASSKAKRTKDFSGHYITIPFRSFTVSNASSPKRSVVPPDILNYTRIMKKFLPNDTRGQRSKVPLLSYGDEPVGGVNEQAAVRNLDVPMTAPYTWHAGQYAGLTKTQTAGGATRYMTFRRVSTRRLVRLPDGRLIWRGSDPNSWIHPGQAANPVSEAVENFIAPQVSFLMEHLVNPQQ
jgi:hypothetical protein